MNTKLLVTCAALAFAAHTQANAATETLVDYKSGSATTFDDAFSFQLTSPSSITAVGTLLQGTNLLVATLYSGSFLSAHTEIGAFAFGGSGATASSQLTGSSSFSNLSTGKYFFNVATTTAVPSLNGTGKYSFTATTLAVPEPETYALALIGLTVVGGGLRLRKKSASEA